MSKNTNLHTAKKDKNNEFYTQLSDIEKELVHYKKYLKGSIVFCNCDDPEESMFWQYFKLNFDHLGLKGLIATHYDPQQPTYKLEYDGSQTTRTQLSQNGDFRSPECVEILKTVDLVVTNPPFSLFREYVDQLVEHGKKFLIIGNQNAITYKEVFKYIKDNKVWLGYTAPKEFRVPDGGTQKFGNICWFTNLSTKKRSEPLILVKDYKPEDHPKYDNYDAINVDRTVDIPADYWGAMGVPITFLDKYCPDQFEVIGQMVTTKVDEFNHGYPYVGGKKIYARILIKRKKNNEVEDK